MFDYTKDTKQYGITDQQLLPHPDGKAWPKCCRGDVVEGRVFDCAFIRNQEGGARLSKDTGQDRFLYSAKSGVRQAGETPFMCCHRSTDDGYYRVCAGWDACFGNKAITAKS